MNPWKIDVGAMTCPNCGKSHVRTVFWTHTDGHRITALPCCEQRFLLHMNEGNSICSVGDIISIFGIQAPLELLAASFAIIYEKIFNGFVMRLATTATV